MLRMFFTLLNIYSFIYMFPVELVSLSLSTFIYLRWCEHEVVQLVKPLRYKPEGPGFDSASK